jgi:hypothetical protein
MSAISVAYRGKENAKGLLIRQDAGELAANEADIIDN